MSDSIEKNVSQDPPEDWFTILIFSIYNLVILGMTIKWFIPETKKLIKEELYE